MSTVLGDRLRELRGDIRQATFAEAIGVSAASVSSWESGSATPSKDRMVQIARAVTPDRWAETLTELMTLREISFPGSGPSTGSLPTFDERAPTVLEVLLDIRYLLNDLRSRLPPREQ